MKVENNSAKVSESVICHPNFPGHARAPDGALQYCTCDFLFIYFALMFCLATISFYWGNPALRTVIRPRSYSFPMPNVSDYVTTLASSVLFPCVAACCGYVCGGMNG